MNTHKLFEGIKTSTILLDFFNKLLATGILLFLYYVILSKGD